MQIQPMVTVKKAAALLGIDKSVLRQRVSEGSLKGERRLIGSKEKWFLYCGELDALLDQRFADPGERAERVSLAGMTELFTAGEVVPIDGAGKGDSTVDETTVEEQDNQRPRKRSRKKAGDEAGDHEGEFAAASQSADRQSALPLDDTDSSLDFTPTVPAKMLAENQLTQEYFPVEGVLESQAPEVPGLEGIVRCLTIEFAYRLAEERQTIYKLQDQLEEKDMIVRRIPLLEKSLQEVSVGDRDKELEISNLRAHVAILESQVQRLKQPWWQRMNRWLQGS